MVGPTYWAIPTALAMVLLCLWDLYLVDWITDQRLTVGLRAMICALWIDLILLRAG